MSWDIYGNTLRRGHCEVHPHVHEEYPCSVCMAERNYNQQQPSYDIERLNYELDQQNSYIKALESERDALAAQVDALRDAGNEVYAELQQWALCESHEETNRAFKLWLKARSNTPQQRLAEIRAVAGEIGYYNGFKDALVIDPPLPPATGTPTTIDIFAYRVEQASRYAASQYAAKVRQGGEQ